MKKVLFSFALLVAGSTAFAQINKGQFLVGGNVSFGTAKQADAHKDSRVTAFEFSPNAGYFFANQLAGGLRVDFSSFKTKVADDATTDLVVAPFVRYYILPAAQKVNVFADASFGFGSQGAKDKESKNQFQIMAGPAVFLTPNTALEFSVGYKSEGGEAWENAEGDVKRMNSLGLNIGFQIHLGNAKK